MTQKTRTRKHPRVGITFDPKIEPSLTKQSHKAECDINTILKKYEKTGVITHVNNQAPKYGNFENTEDYQTSINSVMEAQANFDGLPSKIRARFGNDPAQLIEFINDDKNQEEARTLGLLTPPPNEPTTTLSDKTIQDLHKANQDKKTKKPDTTPE